MLSTQVVSDKLLFHRKLEFTRTLMDLDGLDVYPNPKQVASSNHPGSCKELEDKIFQAKIDLFYPV
ncbi:MAG: hypothetical protein AAGG68_29520 [Bacteroidota bacterium]